MSEKADIIAEKQNQERAEDCILTPGTYWIHDKKKSLSELDLGFLTFLSWGLAHNIYISSSVSKGLQSSE